MKTPAEHAKQAHKCGLANPAIALPCNAIAGVTPSHSKKSKKFNWREYWERRKAQEPDDTIVLASVKSGDLEIEIPLLQPAKNSR